MLKPPRNFYTMDASHYARNAAAAGHGIQGGAHIIEVIMSLNKRVLNQPTASYTFVTGSGAHLFMMYSGSGVYSIYISDATGNNIYLMYPGLFLFDVLTIVVEGAITSIYIDGQKIIYNATGKLPIFTGLNLDISLAEYPPFKRSHNICGLRFWNYPAGTLPAGWEDEIRKRASGGFWNRSALFGDANMPLCYELDDTIPDASLVIPNRGTAGAAADLTITPPGQWQNVRKLWRTP